MREEQESNPTIAPGEYSGQPEFLAASPSPHYQLNLGPAVWDWSDASLQTPGLARVALVIEPTLCIGDTRFRQALQHHQRTRRENCLERAPRQETECILKTCADA